VNSISNTIVLRQQTGTPAPDPGELTNREATLFKHAELAYFKTPMVAPGKFDFSGHWQNELTSYMDLQINGSVVTGTYGRLN
jgi:hypothetical protein